jgi:DNA-binding response OmpR family regulator
VKFTPIEYQLLLLLLQGQVIADSQMVQEAFRSDLNSSIRINLDKHINKMRSKLRPSGLNIHRVAKYGYVLLADPQLT